MIVFFLLLRLGIKGGMEGEKKEKKIAREREREREGAVNVRRSYSSPWTLYTHTIHTHTHTHRHSVHTTVIGTDAGHKGTYLPPQPTYLGTYLPYLPTNQQVKSISKTPPDRPATCFRSSSSVLCSAGLVPVSSFQLPIERRTAPCSNLLPATDPSPQYVSVCT